MSYTDDQLQDMYLDWVNNFLTVARFAEHYSIPTIEEGVAVIENGRRVHERRLAS